MLCFGATGGKNAGEALFWCGAEDAAGGLRRFAVYKTGMVCRRCMKDDDNKKRSERY